ncbi:MAG: bifunctional protein-serine/threonine kinase/phosphatase [Rhodocyclaceae bacterium]|jgi:serine/threonine protein phosphatase PrpC/predicted Ser/Thr protein kinase|nr:MAG: bifunctional protein-serine/threonine kinase/phosphatase [Rhodocyclaceae bacterium]
MTTKLEVSVGQHSDKGRKEANQDFHGACIPDEPQLGAKGVAVALADGISSSDVGHIASESAVRALLEDYYCTSDAWSVKTAASRVLVATNSWLHAQTRRSQYRYDKDKGYVCTLSALIFKARTAYLFHVGDARAYRVRGKSLEQLTVDHRVTVSPEQSYLGRAMGVEPHLDIDYQAFDLDEGDQFVLATDGVYEYVDPPFILKSIRDHAENLTLAAQAIVAEAFARGSPDNLTVQIVRIDGLPEQAGGEIQQQLTELPLPPLLEPRAVFDGYKVLRELHGSSRSHIYLAEDVETDRQVVLKIPSIDLRGDPAYLERFMMEQWVAQRIDSAHVLKPYLATRKRQFLYVVTEYIDGQTLTQWMVDHPNPDLETVRGIVEQLARGLLAFHRLEMLHRDLRPDNIMIDRAGTVKIIDFGSTLVAGMQESVQAEEGEFTLGTPQYTAPEYFLGEPGSTRADLFSLAVITYQMLTGRLPYGAGVARARTRSALNRLEYRSALHDERDLPAWVDETLRKALLINPAKRYGELSEFVADLRRPNREFMTRGRQPLIERNPVRFWKGISLLLAVVVMLLVWVIRVRT